MVVSDAIHMLSKEENDDENIRSAHQSDPRNNAPTTSDDDDDDDDDSSDRINIMDGLSSEVLAALLEFQLGGSSTNEEDNDTDTNDNTKFDKDTLCATYRPEDASRIAETLRRLHERDHHQNPHDNRIIDTTTANINNNNDDDDDDTSGTMNEITILPMLETATSSIIETDDRIRHLVQVLQTDGVIRINNVLSSDICQECSHYINQTLLEQDSSSTTTNVCSDKNVILFGNVFARDNRYDMYLHPFRDKLISNILSVLLHPKHSTLGQLFQMQLQQQTPLEQQAETEAETQGNTSIHIVKDIDKSTTANVSDCHVSDCRVSRSSPTGSSNEFIDAEFHELSSLISDPGSMAQPLHPDSPYYPVYAPLWTVFIALQDVTPNMGGTVCIPHTHTEAFHQLLCQNGSNHQNIKSVLRQSEKYQYYRADLNIGDCIVMDSRTFHFGGANHVSSDTRRTLLYFTIRNPYHQSRGYPDCNSLYPDLDGTLKLSQFNEK